MKISPEAPVILSFFYWDPHWLQLPLSVYPGVNEFSINDQAYTTCMNHNKFKIKRNHQYNQIRIRTSLLLLNRSPTKFPFSPAHPKKDKQLKTWEDRSLRPTNQKQHRGHTSQQINYNMIKKHSHSLPHMEKNTESM